MCAQPDIGNLLYTSSNAIYSGTNGYMNALIFFCANEPNQKRRHITKYKGLLTKPHYYLMNADVVIGSLQAQD